MAKPNHYDTSRPSPLAAKAYTGGAAYSSVTQRSISAEECAGALPDSEYLALGGDKPGIPVRLKITSVSKSVFHFVDED